jgi:hypothetical protein
MKLTPQQHLPIVVVTLAAISNLIDRSHASPDAAYLSGRKYPKLLQLLPRRADSSYTLNERNSFTNKLINGWTIEADKRIEIILYFLVKQEFKSNNVDEIEKKLNGYVRFTTNETECSGFNPDTTSDEIFKLKFLIERSKLQHVSSSNTTLLVAETEVLFKYNPRVYFTCLHFSFRDPAEIQLNKLDFVHQGTWFLTFLDASITNKTLLT